MSGTSRFTAKKALYLNMSEDGIKIRSNRIESKKAYKRKPKNTRQQGW